jgi:hypothetical protein
MTDNWLCADREAQSITLAIVNARRFKPRGRSDHLGSVLCLDPRNVMCETA